MTIFELNIKGVKAKIRSVTPKIMFELSDEGINFNQLTNIETGALNREVFEKILFKCLIVKGEKNKQVIYDAILDDWQLFMKILDYLFYDLRKIPIAEERAKSFRKE